MNFVSSNIIQEILYFLDIQSLKECNLVCKHWHDITNKDSFWKTKFQRKASSSFQTGPYFNYLGHEAYLEMIDCEHYEVSSFNSMKTLAHKLENPQLLEIKSFEASSTGNFESNPENSKRFEMFWGSAESDSKESDDYLLFELQCESLIFTVNFLLDRLKSRITYVFPPRSVKLSIGATKDCSDYETGEFEVDFSHNYNSISVLPKLISGKFIKLHFLGKQVKMPTSGKWCTKIKLLEIVGYPSEYHPDPLLKSLKQGNFSFDFEPLSPFYLERLEKYKKISNYVEFFDNPSSETVGYFDRILTPKHEDTHFEKYYCEMIGDYYFQKGKYKKAYKHYCLGESVWGVCKVHLMRKNFEYLMCFISQDDSSIPNAAWVVKTARILGGEELERITIDILSENGFLTLIS